MHQSAVTIKLICLGYWQTNCEKSARHPKVCSFDQILLAYIIIGFCVVIAHKWRISRQENVANDPK